MVAYSMVNAWPIYDLFCMQQAISLRERLVALIQQEADVPQQQTDMTQARSYLSNVLISRCLATTSRTASQLRLVAVVLNDCLPILQGSKCYPTCAGLAE